MKAPRLAWVRCQTRPFAAYSTTGSLPAALWSVWFDADRQTWRAQCNETPARDAEGQLRQFKTMERAMAWCEGWARREANGTDLALSHGGGEPCEENGSGCG